MDDKTTVCLPTGDAGGTIANAQPDSDASSQAPPRTTQRSSSQPSATQKDDNKDDNASQSGSAKATGSQQGTKTTGKPKATSFDPRLPAGGISMITPGALAGDQFYKIGNYITFAWNYTSLSVTPTAIDVMASCSRNQATYTIAVNMSASETKVIWDTKNTPSGQTPFLTDKYTLLIYDSDSAVTAAPRAGYLGVFNALTFGMYAPQEYVPWNGKLQAFSTKMEKASDIFSRIYVRQLHQERRFLKQREDDTQGHALHLRHDCRLITLLRTQLRSVVEVTVSALAHRTSSALRRMAFLYIPTPVYITFLTSF